MIIIFDFNRTLYDPETGSLVDGAVELLESLSRAGATIHLVSKLEPGRTDILETLGIASYFSTTELVSDKSEAIRVLIESGTEPVFVIGDHLHEEIRTGNRYGAKTIWLRRGKFSNLAPETEFDRPWRTAADMRDVRELLM